MATEFLHNNLEGLRAITISDREKYKAALERTPQSTWMNYFPFLMSWNSSPSRSILLGEDNGSLCIYLLIHWPRYNRLHLYLPPMPMDNQVLHRCFERINAFNGDLRGRLMWIGAALKEEVEATGRFNVKEFDQEFIYAPEAFQDLSGSRFRILRHHLKKAEKDVKIEARPFTLHDKSGCLKLLEKWRKTLSRNGIKVEGYAASRACINFIELYSNVDLQGRVYEIEGHIRGLAFGGHLVGTTGCSFVHVSDHDFPSLGYYIPYEFFKNMNQFSVINEAGTNGMEGVAFVKKNLSPVRLESIFRGRQKQAGADALQVEKTSGVLGGMKILSYEDHEIFQHCSIVAGKKSWISYFPFLCSLNKRKQHTLYWELYHGSICLYHLTEKSSGKRLNLYFPPFPYRNATLAYAMAKVNLFNKDKEGEITWVEEIDRDDISRLGYEVRQIESEYIYAKETLDQFIKGYDIPGNVATRRYCKEDEDACLDLLERWRVGYLEQGGKSTGYYYKRACIRDAFKYINGNLVGEVLLVDENIQGVCFAGAVNSEHAVFFVTITALEFAELKMYQQASIAQKQLAKFYNNSGERHGEMQRKPILRPAAEGKLYRARQPVTKRTELSMGEVKDKNAALYIEAARELGLQIDIVSASYSYCVISDGKKSMHVYHNSTSISDVATRKVTHNKYLSQNILRKHGIPVPAAKVFDAVDIENILEYVEKCKPVVIKPLKGSNSVGVTVDSKNEGEIRQAVSCIENGSVMVEQYVYGDDYRILICNGRIIDVLRWFPPYVTGNGIDSIHDLVEVKNKYYLSNDLHIIEIDFDYLAHQGYNVGAIPVRGQRIFLNTLSEPSVGGETVRLEIEAIHPVNKRMFLKIAEVSGLALVGVDFISRDISIPYTKNGAGINEINSTPHVWPHFFAEQKDDLSAVKAIIKEYFSE